MRVVWRSCTQTWATAKGDLLRMPGSHAALLLRVGFLLSLQLALQILYLTAVACFQGRELPFGGLCLLLRGLLHTSLKAQSMHVGSQFQMAWNCPSAPSSKVSTYSGNRVR